MTNRQYWTRWALAASVWMLVLTGVLHVVVTRPIVAAVRATDPRLTPLASMMPTVQTPTLRTVAVLTH